MKNWSVKLIAASFFICAAAAGASADEIYLTSGERIKGLVVEEHHDRIIFSTADGERTVMRSAIDEVFFDEPERNYLYLGNEALEHGDVTAAAALFRKALQLNPELEEAQDAVHRTEELRQKLSIKKSYFSIPEGPWRVYGMRIDLGKISSGIFPVVTEVEPQTPAAAAGFQVGDKIVAVWGESMAYQQPGDALGRIEGLPGSLVKVTLQREVEIQPSSKRWPGFEMEMSLQGLKVSRVSEGGHLIGLQQGDIIYSFNGHPTRYLPLGAARNSIMNAKQKGLRLVLRRHTFIQRPKTGV